MIRLYAKFNPFELMVRCAAEPTPAWTRPWPGPPAWPVKRSKSRCVTTPSPARRTCSPSSAGGAVSRVRENSRGYTPKFSRFKKLQKLIRAARKERRINQKEDVHVQVA